MAADVSRGDFQELHGRVAVVEREIEGEKVVSRYILEQTRRNGDDLAALKTRLDRVESRLDRVESEIRELRDDGRQLRQDLPAMIADTMRGVLRERDGG
jgi:tetrahydromethanopterin S-methyltransferase subunit G